VAGNGASHCKLKAKRSGLAATHSSQGDLKMASSNQGGDLGSPGGKDPAGKEKSGTSNRGFASMDPDKQREIASKGGKAAHESGNAHEFTS
jgi:hypothetical protein